MNEIIFNEKVNDLSLIKPTSINVSIDSLITDSQLFPKGSSKPTIDKVPIMLKRKETNYIPSTPYHKKTISNRFLSAQQFTKTDCMNPKVKTFFSPTKINSFPQKVLFNNKKAHVKTLSYDKIPMPLKITTLCQVIQADAVNSLNNIHKEFTNEIDVLYQDNLKKIEEVNEKYNYELFKTLSDTNNTSSSNDRYNQLLSDKNNELSEIENDFLIKKNYALLKYNTNICGIREEIAKKINDQRKTIKHEVVMAVNCKIKTSNMMITSKNKISARTSPKTKIKSIKTTWK